MTKRPLKKRNVIREETVVAMSSAHCGKYCTNKATCNCGSMPSEYNGSFTASKNRYYGGQYSLYVNL